MSEKKLYVAAWEWQRRAEGPFQATVVWTAGCSIRCTGCMNKHLWDRDASAQFFVDEVLLLAIVALGRSYGDTALVFVGGEPMDQAEALAAMLPQVKRVYPETTVVVYSGYTHEALMRRQDARRALRHADILVDGPFVPTLADDNLGYRGSSNQRVIDLNATREAGEVVLADWDSVLVFDAHTVSGPPLLVKGLEISAETAEIATCGAAPIAQVAQ